MYDEAACLGWCKAQENSVSSGGISSVGQSQFGTGKVSLFSDLIGDRPTCTSVRGEILIKRVHCVAYVLLLHTNTVMRPDNAFSALYNNAEQRANIRAKTQYLVFGRILSFCPHTAFGSSPGFATYRE